jgi:AhpD family alkylhydroperoxidase
MSRRFNVPKDAPDALAALLGVERYLHRSGLDRSLIDLVNLRVSQMNGCAYCIDMHWKDLRAAGETEQRLYGLDAWAESPYYTDRERAALAWAEAVTRLEDGHVPDPVFNAARRFFSEKELSDLTLAVVLINGWNRLNIAFRAPAGTYLPQSRARLEGAARPHPPEASH